MSLNGDLKAIYLDAIKTTTKFIWIWVAYVVMVFGFFVLMCVADTGLFWVIFQGFWVGYGLHQLRKTWRDRTDWQRKLTALEGGIEA